MGENELKKYIDYVIEKKINDIVSNLKLGEKIEISNFYLIDLDSILLYVCDKLKVPLMSVKGKSRVCYLVDARRMFCYIARNKTNHSLQKIANVINRSHCMVIHYCKTTNDYIKIKDEKTINLLNIIDL